VTLRRRLTRDTGSTSCRTAAGPSEFPAAALDARFIGGGQNKVLVGSHKCHCPAVRERGGSVHRTHLCLVCQLEVCTPPLNEETCRLGEVRMMALDHGLTGIEYTRQTGKPW
jgi:hypothetical protein